MKDYTEVDQLENGTSTDKIIEIKSVFKTGKHTIQPAFDPKSGWWKGVSRLSEDDKRKLDYYVTVGETSKERSRLNTKIKLEDGFIFDLNKEVDRINWKWVRETKEVAMSFAEAQRSKALFYVHIEGRESEMSVKKDEEMFKAMKLVLDDASTNYVDRALLLNMDMEGEKPSIIKEFLLSQAKKNPKSIFNVYRDKSMKINLLYLKAKRKGIIKVSEVDNVRKYGENIIGISDETCISFLQQNEDILELLERDINPDYYAPSKLKAAMAGKEEEVGYREEEQEDKYANMTPLEKARAIKAEKDKYKSKN